MLFSAGFTMLSVTDLVLLAKIGRLLGTFGVCYDVTVLMATKI